MATGMPPLPPGYTLDESKQPEGMPPLPSGYKLDEPTWQQKASEWLDTKLSHLGEHAGIPSNPEQVGEAIKGIFNPQESPAAPGIKQIPVIGPPLAAIGIGQTTPIVGPALRAQAETLAQPGAPAKVYGSIPLVGPPGYQMGKDIEAGDYVGAMGDAVNIVTQVLGMGKVLKSGPTTSGTTTFAPGIEPPATPGWLGRQISSHFGLSPDYASQVATKVDELNTLRKNAESPPIGPFGNASSAEASVKAALDNEIAKMKGDLSTTVSGIKESVAQQANSLRANLGDLDSARRETGRQLLADTSQAVFQEHARVSKPFQDIGAAIKQPITDANAIRGILNEEAAQVGVRPEELPAAAFKALVPLKDITLRGAAEGLDWQALPEDIRNQINPPASVNFSDLTRVREDLVGAAQSAKDGGVRAALWGAADRISNMQEEAANAAGLGDKYRTAKNDYMLFKRGLGSGLMNDWLNAKDVEEQALTPKLAQLTSKANGESLRTILQSAGVDIKPLDDILTNISETKQGIKELPIQERAAVTAAKGTAAEQISSAKATAAEQMKTAGAASKAEVTAREQIADILKDQEKQLQAKGQVVPGKTTEELAGMSNADINRQRMQALLNNTRAAGVPNPAGLIMSIYGLAHLLSGSPYGLIPLGYGATKLAPYAIARSAGLQNFILRRAGILPNSVMAGPMRSAIAGIRATAPARRRQVLEQ